MHHYWFNLKKEKLRNLDRDRCSMQDLIPYQIDCFGIGFVVVAAPAFTPKPVLRKWKDGNLMLHVVGQILIQAQTWIIRMNEINADTTSNSMIAISISWESFSDWFSAEYLVEIGQAVGITTQLFVGDSESVASSHLAEFLQVHDIQCAEKLTQETSFEYIFF